MQTLLIERQQSSLVKEQEKKKRAARLKKLFTVEYSDSDEDLEYVLATREAQKNLSKMVEKIDMHLQVEQKILEAW